MNRQRVEEENRRLLDAIRTSNDEKESNLTPVVSPRLHISF